MSELHRCAGCYEVKQCAIRVELAHGRTYQYYCDSCKQEQYEKAAERGWLDAIDEPVPETTIIVEVTNDDGRVLDSMNVTEAENLRVRLVSEQVSFEKIDERED